MLIGTLYLQGCSVPSKIAEVSTEPRLSNIENPTLLPNYEPVSMPMPQPVPYVKKVNSLWQDGAKAFFKDQRAHRVGDILTVDVVFEGEKVEMDAKPELTKNNTAVHGINSFLGLSQKLQNALPVGADLVNAVSAASTLAKKGQAKYKRDDKLKFKIAAVITDILPNGNLVLSGRQEVRLLDEVRVIQLKGIVRREDITSANRVQAKHIQNLRILHDSNGEFKDVTALPWGVRAINKLSPF